MPRLFFLWPVTSFDDEEEKNNNGASRATADLMARNNSRRLLGHKSRRDLICSRRSNLQGIASWRPKWPKRRLLNRRRAGLDRRRN